MGNLCEFCKREITVSFRRKRFCGDLCQRKHYNRRPEIREKCRLRMIKYRKNNPEWKEKHRLFQAKYKERNKLYRKQYFQREEVKARMRKYQNYKLKNNPVFAVGDRLRRSLNHALAKYSNTGKIMSSKKYGIDWNRVIACLKPFPKNMKEYEIDHIIPLHTFNLTNPEEIKIAFSPENLRWLTKHENRSKGGITIR